MADWEYQNLQVKTVPTVGIWSKISKRDLDRLTKLQRSGWDVFHVVNIRGSLGFTSHVLFMMRRATTFEGKPEAPSLLTTDC